MYMYMTIHMHVCFNSATPQWISAVDFSDRSLH